MCKRFKSVWGGSFVHTGSEEVALEFVGDSNGYSAEDAVAVGALAVGETWTCKDYSDHTITRIS